MQNSDVGYVFTGYNDSMLRAMFKDCLVRTDIRIIKEMLPFSAYVNGLFRGLFMRFYKHKICQILFYLIEKCYHPLEKVKLDCDTVYLIFTNGASIGTSIPYLNQYLRKHKNCIPVMLFVDQLDRYWSQYAQFMVQQIPQFQCFTFDPQDALKSGYKHTMSVYSYHTVKSGGDISDIYFSFFGLDRLHTVRDIADYLEAHQVRCNFIYAGNIDKDKHMLGTVKHVEKRMSYPKVLQDAAQANCLLEVLRPGQTGATLRFYEAVCYNKKLLTTNKNVVKLPFYNPEYIKVFEKPSDIDYDWVRRRDPVDYHYDGRFSPIHFLEEIVACTNHGN